MLIDLNANIGHWPFKKLKYNTCSSLLARMNQFNVDISVISNLNGVFYKNTQSANIELYDEIKSDRHFTDRFIPFAIINPIYAGWRDDLNICYTKLGMKGIRLYPLYHDYEITDPSLFELVRRARDYGLVVAFTLRLVDSRQRSWMDINKEWGLKDVIPVIKEVPDVKYLILNIANGIKLNDEEMKVIKNADVLFDTSGRDISNLGELLVNYGNNKFGMGTHSPFLDYVTGILRIESLRESEADEKTRDLLRSGNAESILGM